MCHSLIALHKQGLITTKEYNKARNAIKVYLNYLSNKYSHKWAYIALAVALTRNKCTGLVPYTKTLAVYTNWKRRPR